MKMHYLIILMLALSFNIFAQNKVAIINSDAFEDEKNGIKILVEAINKVNEEFKPKNDELKLLRDKINEIAKKGQEMQKNSKGSCPLGPINEIQKLADELENLLNDYKDKNAKYKFEYENRKDELTKIISQKISEKFVVFSKQENHTFYVDKRSIENGSIIIHGETIDITKEFIEFCNTEFEKEKAKKLK
jgi:Skp family chaperone for outer membrane proteins